MDMDEFRYRINKLSYEMYLHINKIEIFVFKKCHNDLKFSLYCYSIIENTNTINTYYHECTFYENIGFHINELELFNLN